MTCPSCGSERTTTHHTDRKIVITCKDCRKVSEERYGPYQRKSEAEEAADTVMG